MIDLEAYALAFALTVLAFAYALGYYFGARAMERRMRTPRLRPLSIVDATERA